MKLSNPTTSSTTYQTVTSKLTTPTNHPAVSSEITALKQNTAFHSYLTVLLVSLGIVFTVVLVLLLYKKCDGLRQRGLADDSDVKYLQQGDDDDTGVADTDSMIYQPRNAMKYHHLPSQTAHSSNSSSSASSSGSTNSTLSIRKPVRPSPPVPPPVKLDDSCHKEELEDSYSKEMCWDDVLLHIDAESNPPAQRQSTSTFKPLESEKERQPPVLPPRSIDRDNII